MNEYIDLISSIWAQHFYPNRDKNRHVLNFYDLNSQIMTDNENDK